MVEDYLRHVAKPVPYDEQYHLATMTRQQLRHGQNQIA
jgi:hypothetical protein